MTDLYTSLDAKLYKYVNTAVVISEGFGVFTNHDACLTLIDNVVYADKFGLKRTGPGIKKEIDQCIEKYGEDYFDVFAKDCTLKVYKSTCNDYFFIPALLDENTIHVSDDCAIADEKLGAVYKPSYDERDQDMIILSEIGQSAIQKMHYKEVTKKIGSRFKHLIAIQAN